MDRVRLRRLVVVVLSAGFAAAGVANVGCSPGALGWLLRDSKTKPEHPLPPKEGKKEVTVLVIVTPTANVSINPAFASSARNLAGLIGKRMMDDTRESKNPIRPIDQSKFDALRSTTADWRSADPAVIGQKLGADYVIDATLTDFSIFQPDGGGEFYAGRASLNIDVYDSAQPGKVLDRYTVDSRQPQKGKGDLPDSHYVQLFSQRLASEIAWKHIPHDTDDKGPKLQ